MNTKPGIIRQHYSWLAIIQRLIDTSVVFSLLPIITVMYSLSYSRAYQMAAIVAALLTWVFMEVVDAYRPWRGARLTSEARVLLTGWLFVVVSVLIIAWACKSTHYYSRVVIGFWLTLTPITIILAHIFTRIVLRKLRKNGRNIRTAIVIGAGALGEQLIRHIKDEDWMGIQLLGCFDDDTEKKGEKILDIPVLGNGLDAVNYVSSENVDMVYSALPMRAENRMREIFEALEDTTVSIYMVPDTFAFQLMGARAQEVGGLPVFSLCETPLTGPYGVLKRIEDVLLSIGVLFLTWPLLLLIAIAIKLSSPGPILFRQHRYGLSVDEVVVWKFRTMSVCEDGYKAQQAKKNDSRVTKIGRILRRTSLDELPQFINVLQGHMSVVGPRPHPVALNEQYRKLVKRYMWRHKMKPGITGWAQVNGWRGETDTLQKMQKRVEYDLDYIRNWSLWLDLKIVLLTVIKGFNGKNAY